MELGKGTVAVVTGAGSGIGLALANGFAAAGCTLVLADVQDDALAAAEAEIRLHGVDTLAVRTDVSKVEQVDALAAATIERFGAVHVLCNNAGVAGKGDPWFGGIESWQWVMGVNFWGVVHGIRAFLPHIAASGTGHIVNTASMAGLMPGFSPAYDASKHAVVAISEGLYSTLRTAGLPIGVSCLCPGWIRTGILDSDRNWPDELGERPAADACRRDQPQARRPGHRRGHAARRGGRPRARRRARRSLLGVPEPRLRRDRDATGSRPSARASIHSPWSRCPACHRGRRSSPR